MLKWKNTRESVRRKPDSGKTKKRMFVMNSDELQFRTATLGGFNKQDVLNYIEMILQEHSVKLEAAEKAREELVQERDTLKEEAALTGRTQEGLKRQVEALRERLEKMAQELDQTKQELEQEREGRENSELRVLELEERLSKAEPAAAAYESVKDRTAGIELEAHHRAKKVEEAAKEQVKATKEELERWIQTSRLEYDCLRGEVETAVSQAAKELDQVGERLQKLTSVFVGQDAALEKLLKEFQSSLGAKNAAGPGKK